MLVKSPEYVFCKSYNNKNAYINVLPQMIPVSRLDFKLDLISNKCMKMFFASRLGGPPLCDIFPRLFRLEVIKECRVCDRCPSIIPLSITTVPSPQNDTTFSFIPCHSQPIVNSIQRPNTQILNPILPPGLLFNWSWNRPLRSTAEILELEELAFLQT